MKKELHLFILWKNALDKKKEILDDIKKSFKLRNIYKVIWNDKNWSDNLSRFYGQYLPEGSGKAEHCGKEYFYLIIVEDEAPEYGYRVTSHGLDKVNINMFNKKELYREWTGGGHKIHSTYDLAETNHDLTLLLGMNAEDFLKKVKPSKKIEEYKKDLIGTKSWDSVEEIFYVLNNCSKYVVLRDYENDMKELYKDPSYDVDMLCENKQDLILILNATEKYIDHQLIYEVDLKDKKALFDLKYSGDDYYCLELEEDILENRVLHHGYYIPSKEYAYLANLFHAIVHKNNYETEYNERLSIIYPKEHDKKKSKEYYIEKLSNWMRENGYVIKVQKDNPYKMNIENIKIFDSRFYEKDIFQEIELGRKMKTLEDTIYEQKEHIKNLENNVNHYQTLYKQVISSKGWKFLEKIRKLRNFKRK